MTNEELLKEYPFLSISNSIYPEYFYNFDDTLLDDMPSGWRKRFGLQMCADIKQALEKNNIIIELYKVFQVKEKFGELHWYDNNICEDVKDIVDTYCFISKYVCCNCGDIHDIKLSNGWICPYCEKCREKLGINHYFSVGKIPNKCSHTVFVDNEPTLTTIDITETLYKIGFTKEDILWQP